MVRPTCFPEVKSLWKTKNVNSSWFIHDIDYNHIDNDNDDDSYYDSDDNNKTTTNTNTRTHLKYANVLSQ